MGTNTRKTGFPFSSFLYEACSTWMIPCPIDWVMYLLMYLYLDKAFTVPCQKIISQEKILSMEIFEGTWDIFVHEGT